MECKKKFDAYWLQTVFQTTLETSLQLLKKEAPEETPYIHKYKAIELLKSLLAKSGKYIFFPLLILGECYSEVDQNADTFNSYSQAIKCICSLSNKERKKFAVFEISGFNMLALCYVNREEIENGLGCLAHAYNLYQETILLVSSSNVVHNRQFFNKNNNDIKFNYYYEGGISEAELNNSHTLTHFYLAQCFAKLSLKDQAARHCGTTLQMQYVSQKYEINDFCHNLIGLSEYYSGIGAFSQASYLLELATRVLPANKKKKMHAIVEINIGKLYSLILESSCEKIRNNSEIKSDKYLKINEKLLLFSNFDFEFPKITLAENLEGCKHLFRIANTQFKKAIEVFVLDGFVTEHVDILHEQSKLYKSLTSIEKSRERVASMLNMRLKLLEPLLTEINPKAFAATWQKILVEVAEVEKDLFYLRNLIAIDSKNPNEAKIEEANGVGDKAIKYFEQISEILLNDKDTERSELYFRSVVNSMFSIAKLYSKMMSTNIKKRVYYLKNSLDAYKKLDIFLNKEIKPELKQAFEKENQMTIEMIQMLPTRIDRVNCGMMSPIE